MALPWGARGRLRRDGAQRSSAAAGWLTAGAVTLGLGAALLTGAAAANADSNPATHSANATTSHSVDRSSARHAPANSVAAQHKSPTSQRVTRAPRVAAPHPITATAVPAVRQTAAAPAPVAPVAAPAVGCGPAAKQGCWETGTAQTSMLTALDMVIGQLKGGSAMLGLDVLKTTAAATPSVSRVDQKWACKAGRGCGWVAKDPANPQPRPMYLNNKTDSVGGQDGFELLASNGIQVTGSVYPKQQEKVALQNLTTALADGKSAIVMIKSEALDARTGTQHTLDHYVTVIRIDEANNMVYVNDGALPDGQNKAIPLRTFLNDWKAKRFETAIAELKPEQSAPEPTLVQTSSAVSDPPSAASVPDHSSVPPTSSRAGHSHSPVARVSAVTQAFQGGRGALAALSSDLARRYGTSSVADSSAPVGAGVTAAPKFIYPDTDTVYGDPNKNVQFWGPQKGNTCVLMSSAMMMGQFTGKMKTWRQMVRIAEGIDSEMIEDQRKPGWFTVERDGVIRRVQRRGAIYENDLNQYVFYVDAVKLLDKNGFDATFNFYAKSDGDWALSNLESALDDGKAVMVSIYQDNLYRQLYKEPVAPGLRDGNHAIVVLGVNETQGLVYLNDSALTGTGTIKVNGKEFAMKSGQGITVSLSAFMSVWQAGGYVTVTAVPSPATAAQALPAAA